MRRGARNLGYTALWLIAACDTTQPELTIRSTGKPLPSMAGPVSARVADGRAQLALGNVALALETFRRAVREEPRNIDAITGLAASYDRMGRFDVSRRHYEAALAVEPGNRQVLASFAASLDAQGKAGEAAAVRSEIRQRGDAVRTAARAGQSPHGAPAGRSAIPEEAAVMLAAPDPVEAAAPLVEARALPVAAAPVLSTSTFPTAPAREVTVMLAAPRPLAAAPTPPAAAVPAQARLDGGPRLERTSLAEVVLVTRRAEPLLKSAASQPVGTASAVRFVPLSAARDRVAVRVINAARVDRLAATTRSLIVRRGWSNVTIGNAAAIRARSIVLYPAALRAAARRLAAQLGLRSAPRAGRGEVTVLLGRDATLLVRRRGAS